MSYPTVYAAPKPLRKGQKCKVTVFRIKGIYRQGHGKCYEIGEANCKGEGVARKSPDRI